VSKNLFILYAYTYLLNNKGWRYKVVPSLNFIFPISKIKLSESIIIPLLYTG